MNTQDKIKLLEKVKINLKAIREVLDRQVSNDDISGVTDKLIDLIEISGTASYTEAVAKSIYESELGEVLELLIIDSNSEKMGRTNLLTIAKGKISQYQSAVTYSERLGRNISHSLDALRSVLSLQKEEMNKAKWGVNT